MAKRTGAPSIHKVAKRLCILLGKYSGLLSALYPTNTALIAALAAAQAACTTLIAEVEGVLEPGD